VIQLSEFIPYFLINQISLRYVYEQGYYFDDARGGDGFISLL